MYAVTKLAKGIQRLAAHSGNVRRTFSVPILFLLFRS